MKLWHAIDSRCFLIAKMLKCEEKKNKTHFISTLRHWASQLAPVVKNPAVNVGDARDADLIHSAGDQPWDFFGRNDAKAEAPVLWPPHAKS